jgi:hypothetical protein
MIGRICFATLIVIVVLSSAAFSQPGWNINFVVSSPSVNTLYCMATYNPLPWGDYLCAGDSNLFWMFDYSTPIMPVNIGSCQLSGSGKINDIAVASTFAYATCQYSQSFRVINIADPSTPTPVASMSLGYLGPIAVHNNYAYVGSENGLRIIDITNPLTPALVYTGSGTGIAGITVQGNYLYITSVQSSTASLGILDISNPTNPIAVGSWSWTGSPGSVTVSGNYAYLSTWVTLAVIDVSNPANPHQVGGTSDLGHGLRTAVLGDYCYTTSSDGWLYVLNKFQPDSLFVVGNYNASEPMYDVFAVFDYGYFIFVANDAYLGVYQYTPPNLDVTLTPVNPPIVIPAQGGSFSFTAQVASNESSPATFSAWIMQYNPLGQWQGPMLGPLNLTIPGGITISRQRQQNVPSTASPGVYTYRGYVGIYSNTKWDSSSFQYTKSSTADGVQEVTNWTNLGDSFPGDETVSSQPATISLCGVHPNPFNPSTVASFELRVAGHVSLKVYDTAGRLVSTLVDGWREAGSHEVTFDGSNLSTGIYLLKLSAGDYTAVQKLVLLK